MSEKRQPHEWEGVTVTESERERERVHGETVIGRTRKETSERVREKSTVKNRDKTR